MNPDTAVELWTVRIPLLLGLAEHHWFVIRRGDDADRWEIWQTADVGGESWRHLHRNLMPPEAGMGRSPARRLRQWTGAVARELATRIEGSPTGYQFCNRYLVWPGPNSNTWIQWVLGNTYRLGWRGWGRGRARKLLGPLPALAQDAEPTAFEAAVLRWIAERNVSLATQLPTARIVRRAHTGVGMFVEFTLDEPLRKSGMVGGPHIEVAGVEHPAGSILWLKDGTPSCLEIFAYGTWFPADVEEFTLAPGVEAQRPL